MNAVHQRPPAGSRTLPCCGRDIGAAFRLTPLADDVTCTDRKIAELVVDTDDGESPFGWREDEGLAERFAAVLVSTPRADCTRQPPAIHGEGGHFYDGRCALCTGDIGALAAALADAARTPTGEPDA